MLVVRSLAPETSARRPKGAPARQTKSQRHDAREFGSLYRVRLPCPGAGWGRRHADFCLLTPDFHILKGYQGVALHS